MSSYYPWSRHIVLSFTLTAVVMSGCGERAFEPSPADEAVETVAAAKVSYPPTLEQGVMAGSDYVCALLHDGADPAAVAADHQLTLVESFGGGKLALYTGQADLAGLQADERVRMAQHNSLSVLSTPVDITMGFFEGDWDETGLGQQDALTELSLPVVHRHTRGAGVRVAVLDTGIDPDHPVFAGRLDLIPEGSSVLSSLESANGVDEDGDGLVDEAFGHGTHVAGTIAMIAPDATLLPIRVLNSDGFGSAFELAMGLYTASAMGADVVNLSLILDGESKVIERVLRDVEDDGVIVVGAAGNFPGDARFPASDSHVVSVAASTMGRALADFSASGEVQLAAPGVQIESSFPGGGSAVASGTSMACAVASGCVTLIRANTPGAEATVHLLRESARPLAAIEDGIVDPLAAVRRQHGKDPSQVDVAPFTLLR